MLGCGIKCLILIICCSSKTPITCILLSIPEKQILEIAQLLKESIQRIFLPIQFGN